MAAAYEFDIGVVGGGAAGLTVAAGSAQLGAKTLLIEKEEALGGDCLHFGCVPSKTLIRIARVRHLMRRAERFGLPAPVLPEVDYQAVQYRIRSVIERIQQHDSQERFCGLGVRVEQGTPVFSDPHSVQLHGRTFKARSWVVATGSSPAVPPFPGLDQTSFLTNKDLFSLERLPRSMIVLGAGPIAMEMAQAFCRLGTRVEVIQRSNQVLSKEDKDMADVVMHALMEEGVKFHLNTTVSSIRETEGEKEVAVERKHGAPQRLRAEAILVAMGRTPNLGGLGLEQIGVELTRKGLVLDERLRTTHKHLYGAGDVTGTHLFTHAAGYEGSIVVSNAVFRIPRKADYTFMPWCTYTQPELAGMGMNEKRAAEAEIDYSIYTEKFINNDRALAEGEETGKIKLLLDEKEKPIGVQIVGPHAGELLNEWVAILYGKTKLSTLAASVHPYPTLGEINKRVVGSFYSQKIFSDRVKKLLRLFFHFKGRACGAGTPEQPGTP